MKFFHQIAKNIKLPDNKKSTKEYYTTERTGKPSFFAYQQKISLLNAIFYTFYLEIFIFLWYNVINITERNT